MESRSRGACKILSICKCGDRGRETDIWSKASHSKTVAHVLWPRHTNIFHSLSLSTPPSPPKHANTVLSNFTCILRDVCCNSLRCRMHTSRHGFDLFPHSLSKNAHMQIYTACAPYTPIGFSFTYMHEKHASHFALTL